MSINREQAIFLQNLAELIRKASDYGLMLTGGELYRTPEQQALHIKNGRSKTMDSQHLKRMAIDLNFFQEEPDGSLRLVYDEEPVRQLGAFWESLDPANRWGGNWSSFKDTPHFERKSMDSPSAVSSRAISSAASTSSASGRGKKLLSDAVGPKCRNLSYDVKSVQYLLNLNAKRFKLADTLKCDGVIGKKTVDAICAFQNDVMFVSSPNGTIRPGDAALLELCTVLPQAINEAVVQIVFVNADEQVVRSMTPYIVDTMKRNKIDTPLRQAHFLAQVGHESGELRFREELASGAAYENRKDLGNIHPGDGVRYKGRGLIQLTGRANYAEYSLSSGLNKNVEDYPDLVATDDQLCVDVAGWFWNKRGLNAIADKDDLEAITRKINGGLNGLDDRRRLLLRAKTLLNI